MALFESIMESMMRESGNVNNEKYIKINCHY